MSRRFTNSNVKRRRTCGATPIWVDTQHNSLGIAMCGIVGALAARDVTGVLTEGLRRLEYRGYDSCGVAVLQDGVPRRVRSTERVADLAQQVEHARLSGTIGIAH